MMLIMMKQLLHKGVGPLDWTANKTVLRASSWRKLNKISQQGLKIILPRAEALLAQYCKTSCKLVIIPHPMWPQ